MNAPLLAAEQMDGADLHRQVLTSLEEMDALTPEWNELLTQYAGRNLFLTPPGTVPGGGLLVTENRCVC